MLGTNGKTQGRSGINGMFGNPIGKEIPGFGSVRPELPDRKEGLEEAVRARFHEHFLCDRH